MEERNWNEYECWPQRKLSRIISKHLSNDKNNSIVMSLVSFIQEKTAHGLGQYSASQAEAPSSQGILGKNEFCGALEEATQKW